MKKTLLTIMAFTAMILTVNAQQRVALYEEFTGENCGPCAGANPGLEALMAANPTKIIHVTYMENIPLYSPHNFYTSAQPISDARIGYYNAYWSSLMEEFTPSGMLDGRMPDSSVSSSSVSCGNVASFKQADIDAEYAKPSPFTITATHYFNTAHDSVFGKVIVKAVSVIGGSQMKLRVAYVKSMNFATPPGTNGESHFENSARAMFPNTTGQSLPVAWAVGTSDTLTYKGKITGLESTLSGVTILDSNFVVWVQNDSTGSMFKVQQAALSTYHVPVPAGVTEINGAISNIQIAPNPAANYLNVQGTLDIPGTLMVTITNTVGQTVYEKEYAPNGNNFSQRIPLDNIKNGIYFLNLTNNGEKVTKKFVVER